MNKQSLMQDNEYNNLLQRTVAVIESARASVAKSIAAASMNAYWEIGKLLL